MLRKTKIIGGGTLVAASAVGIAVPAYAASSSPTAPTTSTPTTPAKPHHGGRHGVNVLGLTHAVVAKAAGTDTAGLRSGRKSGKSLAQIAAGHNVSRATLLSRLDATADAKVASLINTPLRTKPGKGRNGTMPKSGSGRKMGMNHHVGPHGLRGIPGIGGQVKSLAGTLKVTPNQLRADLRKGQTLQQIATAHKVSTTTLTAAIDKDVNAAVAKIVDRVPHSKKPSA